MRQHVLVPLLAVFLSGYASVARADVCNLTVYGSTCNAVSFGGAVYTNILPVGTFYIDPFLQLKATGTEQGYNTGGDYVAGGGRDYQFNQTGTTTNLLLSDVPVVSINGTEYRQFLLAINEPGSDPLLSLDQLQVFLSPSANLMNYDTGARTLSGLTAIYDLDAGGTDNRIVLNYMIPQYTGPGTAIVYIPNSLFTNGQYVYVYSQFGSQNGAGGAAEEWWVLTDESGTAVTRMVTPEPGTLALVGTGAALLAARRRRRRAKALTA